MYPPIFYTPCSVLIFVFSRNSHCSLVDRRPSAFYYTRITSTQGGDRSVESPMSSPAVAFAGTREAESARLRQACVQKRLRRTSVVCTLHTTPTPLPPLLPLAERGTPAWDAVESDEYGRG